MEIKNGSGEHMRELSKKNLEEIRQWFLKNPGGTKKECSVKLKLSYPTVLKHVKDIQAKE
jgi:DNA-binding CsgD family transcriptional regulator